MLENLIVTSRSKTTGTMVKINLLKSRVEEKIDLQRSSADSSRPDEAYVFTVISSTVKKMTPRISAAIAGDPVVG